MQAIFKAHCYTDCHLSQSVISTYMVRPKLHLVDLLSSIIQVCNEYTGYQTNWAYSQRPRWKKHPLSATLLISVNAMPW